MTLDITPETRVGELLDAYPGLEETLIAIAPPFARLKNPLLRKTVAKVATLDQAARIGGLPVRDLVLKLRAATGQAPAELPVLEASPDARPTWVGQCAVRFRIDADEMLAKGVHPIGQVRQQSGQLSDGEMLELVVGFRPEPLIETMRRSGFRVFSEETEPGKHTTYIAR